MLFIDSGVSYYTELLMLYSDLRLRLNDQENSMGNIKSVSPFPLLRSLSGSSRMTKVWGNSDRDPLKLNLNVWLSRLRSLEKLFLRGGGAIPRPFSLACGDIRRSVRLSTSSVAASICSVMMCVLTNQRPVLRSRGLSWPIRGQCRSCILVSAAEYLINFSLLTCNKTSGVKLH